MLLFSWISLNMYDVVDLYDTLKSSKDTSPTVGVNLSEKYLMLICDRIGESWE